ncbi:MAG TPA: DUF2089 family protein [Gemmataceae bacterium]|jgi:hypothetical protein|nr:DUF2089 family protein [Gemmataceae bacterium]
MADDGPPWLRAMDDADRQFLKRFVLASGSLKDVAAGYGISYPTVRARLDRLIAKVQAAEDPAAADEFERKLRVLTADGTVPLPAAKALLAAHRQSLKKRDAS